jgi:hypothetical protein
MDEQQSGYGCSGARHNRGGRGRGENKVVHMKKTFNMFVHDVLITGPGAEPAHLHNDYWQAGRGQMSPASPEVLKGTGLPPSALCVPTASPGTTDNRIPLSKLNILQV